MGCWQSSNAAHFRNASGPETQRYFDLEGLPLTLSTEVLGSSGIELRVTGLLSNNALLRLELAIARRGLVTLAAKLMNTADQIADWTFELHMKSMMSSLSPPRRYGTTLDINATAEIVPAEVIQDLHPGVALGSSREVVQVTVKYRMVAGCRAAIINELQAMGLRLVCAVCKGTVNDNNDKYWLQLQKDAKVPQQELNFHIPKQVRNALELCQNKGETIGPRPSTIQNTPPRRYEYDSPSKLCEAIKAMDADALHSHRMTAPAALKESLRNLEYPMHGPCKGGIQVENSDKYVGIGLVHRSAAPSAADKASPAANKATDTMNSAATNDLPHKAGTLVLEIRTVFIKQHSSGKNDSYANGLLRAIGGPRKEYAEFVTWLDLQSRVWTVYKLFNNGVLEPGKHLGSLATAEHLLAPADMFFVSSSTGESTVKGVEPAWLTTLQEAACGIETIRICDVVNWNTYLLMAVGARPSRSVQELFGGPMKVVFMQELSHSKMSSQEFQKASLVEIFKKTALGRSTNYMLLAWKEHMKEGELAISQVDVQFHHDHFENIHGEPRIRMDIDVKLELVTE
mmetsp:Transcript_43908/g.84319  ORF Transcript_43908/g.84319 Transcript_43908/m.84319 type:complete len:570 (-) Transcript_43908:136-1845(-)